AADHVAEALDHSLLVRSHDERALPDQDYSRQNPDRNTETTERDHLTELRLCLAEDVIDRVGFPTPGIFRVPNHEDFSPRQRGKGHQLCNGGITIADSTGGGTKRVLKPTFPYRWIS